MAWKVDYIWDRCNKCGPDASGRVEDLLGHLGILDESCLRPRSEDDVTSLRLAKKLKFYLLSFTGTIS